MEERIEKCSDEEGVEHHQIPSNVVDSLVYGESPELGVVRTGSVGSGPFDLGEDNWKISG